MVRLTDEEAALLRALPAPAFRGVTGARLRETHGVAMFPAVYRLLELGLVQRRGSAHYLRARDGELWLRENGGARCSP